jgi:hypothetical protein
MARYITLKVEDSTFEELKTLTRKHEVWLGSPTGDWSPKRAFLLPAELDSSTDTKPVNIFFVDDETFDNIRQATEQVIRSAFQAGATELKNAELFMHGFDESLEPNRPEEL